MADVKDIIKDTMTNLTHTQITKLSSSPRGLIIAYGGLLLMAILPVFVGAFRSVKFHKVKVQKEKASGRSTNKMSYTDAVIFPFIASFVLLTLYIVLKVFSKENLNLIITSYFYILGVLGSSHLLSPVVSKLLSTIIQNEIYQFKFLKGSGDSKKKKIDYSFTFYNMSCVVVCALLGVIYFLEKHWVANNVLGIVFAINGIEMLLLNNVITGCIFLLGLFIYDVFWVFYTDVMITVAKSFDAPIKLVFPQDILEKGLTANNYAMVGLGDIVIPGIFIAMMLRFDLSLNRSNKKTYFHSSFFGYVLGLAITVFFVHYFKKGQPALLYLVPACLGITFIVAICKGDLGAMFKYEDVPKDSRKKRDSSVGKGLERMSRKSLEEKPKSPKVRTASRVKSKSRNRTSPPSIPVTPMRQRRRK